MKKTIRLSESDLHRVIKESVKNVLNEIYTGFGSDPEDFAWMSVSKDTPRNEVIVYQMNQSDESVQNKRFMSWDRLKRFGLEFNPADYEVVYQGPLPADNPEQVWSLLQGHKPEGYRGYSLSTGDVIEMNGRVWFCDSHGFKDITDIWKR